MENDVLTHPMYVKILSQYFLTWGPLISQMILLFDKLLPVCMYRHRNLFDVFIGTGSHRMATAFVVFGIFLASSKTAMPFKSIHNNVSLSYTCFNISKISKALFPKQTQNFISILSSTDAISFYRRLLNVPAYKNYSCRKFSTTWFGTNPF